MAALHLKLSKIGNSRGVRLPVELIQRYGLSRHIEAEATTDGILLKPGRPRVGKLPWAEAARAMSKAAEDWSAWEITNGDGLERL